jgi:hypothetical protein
VLIYHMVSQRQNQSKSWFSKTNPCHLTLTLKIWCINLMFYSLKANSAFSRNFALTHLSLRQKCFSKTLHLISLSSSKVKYLINIGWKTWNEQSHLK